MNLHRQVDLWAQPDWPGPLEYLTGCVSLQTWPQPVWTSSLLEGSRRLTVFLNQDKNTIVPHESEIQLIITPPQYPSINLPRDTEDCDSHHPSLPVQMHSPRCDTAEACQHSSTTLKGLWNSSSNPAALPLRSCLTTSVILHPVVPSSRDYASCTDFSED